jgi:hypothetical protein
MHISENLVFSALVALAVVGWLVSRQLRARRIRENLTFLPIALIVLSFLPPGPVEPKPLAIALFAVTLVAVGALGYLRGMSMKVWVDNAGQGWRQGTALTVVLWIVTIVIRLGDDLLQKYVLNIDVRPGAIWLSLAVTFGVQALISQQRARGLRPGVTAEPTI